MKNKLHIDSVRKSFDTKLILSDVALQCETGDIISVFGRNGSGKSTLLQIIYGALQAESRFIKLNNKVLSCAFKEENALAFLPQNSFLPTNFSVKKAISLFLDENKITDFTNDELIEKNLNLKTNEVSTGELKYLETKLILSSSAKFCLLDEPYSGISPIIAEKINLLIQENEKTKGIIITDHNYEFVLPITTKIYFLKNGTGKFLSNKTELITNGYLSQHHL